ncbi:MAG: SurA N-terminal domain-containing protein [Candidatus Hydrogenedentota bacterium]|nr:MAG: SurA N-terminal domain-containing protein [Candidatus Hydrogenedentota bacterium]
MLLDFMRRNTRNFLIATIVLIVPAFVLWGSFPTLGKRGRQTLLKVGDQKVSLEEFTTYYHNLREITRANLGKNYTPELEKMLDLKQQALDRIIREILLGREVARLNLVVSDEEVQDSLKRNPVFYTDDKFDPSKWNASLNNPRINWTGLIEQERESLRLQKLVNMIGSGARVTEGEIRGEYQRQHEKVRVEFVALKASELTGEVEVSSDDLTSYYEEHKQEYAEPARLKLAYVELKKEPNQMDYDDMRHVAQNILERARAGDDFVQLAERYSDDTATAAKGGDLGFLTRRRMPREFAEPAFSLNPGEISKEIQSPKGYHIIKVEETRGEADDKEVRARLIFLKVEPSEDTLLFLEEQAARLAVGARVSSLERAASEMELGLKTTPEFAETSPVIPTAGYAPEISEILPALGEGEISNVIETRTAFYVVHVTKRTPERIPELQEVEDRVRSAFKMDRALTLARTKAEEILKEVNDNGLPLADIAHAPTVQEAEPFTRRGRPPELPFLQGLVSSVFELPEGNAAGPLMSKDAAYVVQLKEKIPADPSGYDEQRESIKDRLVTERREQAFQDYYENLRKRVGVKINRELLQAV